MTINNSSIKVAMRELMNEGWGPFYKGWLVGVGLAYAEMVETGGSRCLAGGGVMS